MNSAIYTGTVQHRRHSPTPHTFRYRMFMMYLDLDEIDTIFDRHWMWSARRIAPAWFRRTDYLGDDHETLDSAVRNLVQQQSGFLPEGPIRVLTHLRYFGFIMNPVTLYYCFDASGESVRAIVAEITNTPWRERHAYVLLQDPDQTTDTPLEFDFDKQFHVSPFMDMGHRYRWKFSEPGASLIIHMQNHESHERVFDATLGLRRTPITSRSLASVLARFPVMTMQVAAGIYWQAMRLWIKRTPFFTHPAKRTA